MEVISSEDHNGKSKLNDTQKGIFQIAKAQLLRKVFKKIIKVHLNFKEKKTYFKTNRK